MLAFACLDARAELVITDKSVHYDIHGRSLMALRDELRTKGPVGSTGVRVAGLTAAELAWEAVYDDSGTGCRVSSSRVGLDITTTLPRWQSPGLSERFLQRRWQSAAEAIASHEAEHRALAVEAARQLDALVSGFASPRDCTAAAGELRWQAWKLQQRLHRDNERLDRRTGHGLKPAVLP